MLLLSSTGLDTSASFDWNYQPAFVGRRDHLVHVERSGRQHGDIQLRAEYVAYAVREVRARAGRLVDVIGHGQGALVARMALRFWPDLRDDAAGYLSDGSVNRNRPALDNRASAVQP
ncbi:MAG: hypothetical protein M3Z25_12520 [Actinomycetota bacterium]|nr:hypothetical protein [Actinomycetota bacterium]